MAYMDRDDIVVLADEIRTLSDQTYMLREEGEELQEEVEALVDKKAPAIINYASGAIASFSDGADDVPLKGLKFSIEPKQSGSGDPSPTNIRPISGWSQVNGVAAGKNLCPPLASATTSNGVTFTPQSDGSIKCTGTASAFSYCALPSFSLPAGTYTLTGASGWGTGANPIKRLIVLKGGGAIANDYGSGSTFTLTEASTVNVRIDFGSGATTGVTAYPMVRLASDTDATYKPYQGTPIAIQLGQTVYGGTVDAIAGKLVIDRAAVDMGDLTYTYTGYIFTAPVSGAKYATNEAERISGLQSSIFRMATSAAIGQYTVNGTVVRGPSYIAFRDDRYTTAASFKTAMTGQTLVYELATPIEVDLTPVSGLTSMLGQNNVWASCGDTEAEYVADTKLYIEKLTQPTEDDMVANANIESGKYFMIGNALYLSTAAISAGETIKPGTNCTLTNLAAALNAINA